MTNYIENKSALLFMITHYENKCLDYEVHSDMCLDDLYQLYEYDQHMVDIYKQELILLEAKKLLEDLANGN